MKLKVTVNGIAYDIDVEVEEEERPTLGPIVIGGAASSVVSAPTTASVKATSANAVVAPLSGSVARILVEEGQVIEEGQVLLVLEAMKMETEITAPSGGTIARILVSKGDAVQGGEPLIEFSTGSSVQVAAPKPAAVAGAVVAPLAGSVNRIEVEEGQDVTAGQVLLVLEAMKMETEITAPTDGKVKRILVAKGDAVQGGQALIELA